jgi:acid stress chaperone HdeB
MPAADVPEYALKSARREFIDKASFFMTWSASPWRGSMKGRLLLTSALFMFVQVPAQAQVTLDISKITCEEYLMDTVTFSQYVVMWLSGYYNGKRNNTVIEPDAVKKNEEKVNLYCYQHRDTTVMDAAKNVLGFDK